ncbi:EAL domain-containing protein [Novosphingobium sp. G106]|uniref:putative bifunctional diguanylate cyclase/phosphodiesterase n=1 Tax=Novosphingobium sp. G106 TaxID=2849500 RepID=UPI001C2D234C|nr:EAL domain-containing protein [Novosphingobium sp. G106]MBV1686668.1 EAL domain-containing protein [Novosphingobium sp. G106]
MAVANIFKGIGGTRKPGAGAYGNANLRLEVLEDFENAGSGWLWATDAAGHLIYISEHAAAKLECPLEQLLAQPLAALFEPDLEDGDSSGRSLNFRLTAHNKIADTPVRFAPSRAERTAWWSLSGQPKFDANGEFVGYRGSAKDITTEYERKLEDLHLSEYDSLTGLANRHRMGRQLGQTLSAFKAAKRSCALMMLDLDRFKAVNDTMGHPAGDDLLKQVAQRLRRVIGERGEIGRLGGDEFQIILPDIDDRGKLGELSDKLIQMISQPYPIGDKRASIGTSVGIAIAPYDGLEMEELISHSDLALYAAKHGGRGQFRFYSADLKSEAEERRLVDEDLRAALLNDELELHYQPVVRASDHVVIGFEGLARWQHPERGAVGPNVFIPIAEESNLINELGEWALRRACTDATHWPETVRVAVNVSARQFTNPAFVGIVEAALAESGLAPGRLELELTETIFMGDSEETDATFRALKGLGVRLALDDFGTGYSSLSYLRSAPFDKIKVDRTFVDSCTEKDQNSAKIIAAIIGLSDALNMETTVEGVEAFDQYHVVCDKGARYIQGWIYSKALPQQQILENIAAQNFRIEPAGPDRHRSERRSMFRRVGVIHEDHRYEALMRELSRTGASIEGLLGVPVGTGLVLDMGGGQLVVCTVMRVAEHKLGVEFETPLVSDGAGGLCTRHRVSPYALAAAGMPLVALSEGQPIPTLVGGGQPSRPQFVQVVAA